MHVAWNLLLACVGDSAVGAVSALFAELSCACICAGPWRSRSSSLIKRLTCSAVSVFFLLGRQLFVPRGSSSAEVAAAATDANAAFAMDVSDDADAVMTPPPSPARPPMRGTTGATPKAKKVLVSDSPV